MTISRDDSGHIPVSALNSTQKSWTTIWDRKHTWFFLWATSALYSSKHMVCLTRIIGIILTDHRVSKVWEIITGMHYLPREKAKDYFWVQFSETECFGVVSQTVSSADSSKLKRHKNFTVLTTVTKWARWFPLCGCLESPELPVSLPYFLIARKRGWYFSFISQDCNQRALLSCHMPHGLRIPRLTTGQTW